MRVLKDTDCIQISKKIESKQKLVNIKNEGFKGHRWYSNFKENWIQTNISLQYRWGVSWTQIVFKFQIIEYTQKLNYIINEGFNGHRRYSNFKENWIQTKISLQHKWGF